MFALGSGEAVLTYGNGYPSGTVSVSLNGVVLDQAEGYQVSPNDCQPPCQVDTENQYTHDGTRSILFLYNAGDVLRIEEGFERVGYG